MGKTPPILNFFGMMAGTTRLELATSAVTGFISTCNDLQEHGRHPKLLQDNIRHCNCVPRCVPRGLNSGYHVLIETHGSDVGSTPFQIFFPVLRLIPDDQ